MIKDLYLCNFEYTKLYPGGAGMKYISLKVIKNSYNDIGKMSDFIKKYWINK